MSTLEARKHMRLLLIILTVIVVALGGAFALLREPSISRDDLIAKYGGPEATFIELEDGGQAHYRDEGQPDGFPLVLIHGSNASLHTWELWVSELEEDFRIVSMDLPGHGLTGAVPGGTYDIDHMMAFVKEVVDELGLRQFALAGNSMGGNVSWNYALAHPSDVSHLILIASSGVPDPVEIEDPLAFRLVRMPVLNRVLTQITPRSLFADGLQSAFYDKSFVTDEMIDRYWDLALMKGTRGATAMRFRTPYDTSRSENLSQLAMPTLIMWGREDALVPVESAFVFEEEIPNSKLVIYDEIGHIPMEEHAVPSADEVRAFIQFNPGE